jgi:D-glycero-D-manno-heptose 1,7-bisphosphate phosphatase
MKSSAAFLDRDGVVNEVSILNGKPYPPKNLNELNIVDGVKESLELLDQFGYVPVVITNQPDIARGSQTWFTLGELHAEIKALTGITHFYVCPHDDADLCDCRKPSPGLIIQAAKELSLDLQSSFLVGDRWRDIEAGHNTAIKSYFVDNGYQERRPTAPYIPVKSLFEAVSLELKLSNEKEQVF